MKTLWCIQNECGELTPPYEAALHAEDGLHCLVLILPDGDHLTVARDQCHPTALAACDAYHQGCIAEACRLDDEIQRAEREMENLTQPESEKI